MRKNKEKTIEFNKKISELYKGTEVSECLWNEDCSGKIVKAHSIQNNRYLSKISDNGKIINFGPAITENNELLWQIKEIGRSSFSTFKGFCGEHDKVLFQEIEDKDYIKTKEQNFLFAFRALAKELHTKKESINRNKKIFENLKKECDLFIYIYYPDYLKCLFNQEYLYKFQCKEDALEILENEKLTLKLLKLEFEDLKEKIKNKTYNGIHSFVIEFDKEYPVVSNSTFIPYQNSKFENIFTKEEYDKIQKGSLNPMIFSNIFPASGKTFIILSCLEKDRIYLEKFFKDFSGTIEDKKKNISMMILRNSENTAFSPKYIQEKFSEKEKEMIEELFAENMADTTHYSINLFRD